MLSDFIHHSKRLTLVFITLILIFTVTYQVTFGSEENDNTEISSLGERATLFDFDGDGKADISVYRPSEGIWYRINSSDDTFNASLFGLSNDLIAPADYDGDGKTDFAIYRQTVTNPYLNYFYILESSNQNFYVKQLGKAGEFPFSGDWNGDGKAEVGVYRYFIGIPEDPPPPGLFSYTTSATDSNIVRIFVNPGGTPVPGDYDGDGKLDAAVFDSTNGRWIIRQSSTNIAISLHFGTISDIPVPADYNGDGKTDLAVFRSGNWYISTNYETGEYNVIPFGLATDKPVPADYDGDGRADVAVYRDGTWYLLRSTEGFKALLFGLSDDVPVPSAYIP